MKAASQENLRANVNHGFLHVAAQNERLLVLTEKG